jgi:probable rRNA maturation factor
LSGWSVSFHVMRPTPLKRYHQLGQLSGQGSGVRGQESGFKGEASGFRVQRPAVRTAHHIEIGNRQRILRVNRAALGRVVRHVLQAEGVATASLEVALVDDATIRDVHRRFLGLDSATDVLTFPLSEPDEPLAGEIIISAETAFREGPRHGLEPQTEIVLYLIHGILHLCGYDDRTARDVRRMHRRQNELLREIRRPNAP